MSNTRTAKPRTVTVAQAPAEAVPPEAVPQAEATQGQQAISAIAFTIRTHVRGLSLTEFEQVLGALEYVGQIVMESGK